MYWFYSFTTAVDGGWSSYGQWSECTKPCGQGTKTRTRTCDNPRQSGGGMKCQGSATQTASCNKGYCRK